LTPATTQLAPLPQAASRLVVQPQLSLQRRIRGDDSRRRRQPLEPCRHAVVVELGVIAHRGAVQLSVGDRSLPVDIRFHEHGNPLLAFVQGSAIGFGAHAN
jgi:hypothetical protein